MSTIALAHHWLVGMRGGERVLEQMCALFPSAPIHTLVARLDRLSDNLRAHPVIPSPLQGFPGATRHYKKLLPLFGLAIPQMRVARGTRLVFSSDASMIKGLRVPKGVPHVCYCHSPPRYLWDMQETYERGTAGLGPIGRFVFRCAVPPARRFDISAASKVTHFIANSEFVRERIKRIYGRDAVVIYPPVDVEAFDPARPRSDFYLVVSELTAYKRVDLAVEAFRGSDRRLVVIGDGPEMKALREAATENITFLGAAAFSGAQGAFRDVPGLYLSGRRRLRHRAV